jgi:tetratricopeptide (TPR) repeat protein
MDAATSSDLKGSVRLGNYLRQLRAGYGYSLRRVEERARAEGGEIDNSQLSRYEKGICYPSFDKLRVLASVFNVSIQAFSDVVDLEAFEGLKPAAADPRALTDEGTDALRTGNLGLAFACFEKAVELLTDAPTGVDRDEHLAQARINLAGALTRMGKLALAEQELRHALRSPGVNPTLQARALLNLANVHANQGDLVLAEMEADKAVRLAMQLGLELLSARARHTLARVMADRGLEAEAIEQYREAAELYARRGETYEELRVRLNIGSCFVYLGKIREGVRLLKVAVDQARSGGYRYLEALGYSSLGEAFFRQQDHARAQSCFRHSDAVAVAGETKYTDVMFLNAFYEWKIAGKQANPTREKIAFGRLKALRAGLERRFPEVDDFDAHVERGRAHA